MYCIPSLGKDLVLLLVVYCSKCIYYRIFALDLELSEETLVDLHGFDAAGGSHCMYEAITTFILLHSILTNYPVSYAK